MPFKNSHAARQSDPSQFKKFRRAKMKGVDGVEVIFGIKTKDGKDVSEIQSFRFDSEKWSTEQAAKWLKDHKFKASIEKAATESHTDIEEMEEEVDIDKIESTPTEIESNPEVTEVDVSSLSTFDITSPPTADVFESIDDNGAEGTGVLTLITEGWSKNKYKDLPAYFTKQSVADIVEEFKKRPKVFAGHVTDDPVKRIDRPHGELVAFGVKAGDGTIQAWVDKSSDGKHRAKARVHFSNTAIGQAVYKDAKIDPSMVHLSINAKMQASVGKEWEGQKATVFERAGFLYSPDVVSYGAAGGSVDIAMGEVEAAEGTIYAEHEADEKMNIAEAFQSIKERLRKRELMEKFHNINYFFQDAVREIVVDKDGEYNSTKERESAFDEAVSEYKSVLFEMDLSDISKQMKAAEAVQLETRENAMSEFAFQFKTIDELLANEAVKAAFQKQFDERLADALEAAKITDPVSGEETTVQKLKDSYKTAVESLNEYKQKEKKAVAQAVREREFKAVVDAMKVPADVITQSLKQACLEQSDSKRPENFELLSAEEQERYPTAKDKMKELVVEHVKAFAKVAKPAADNSNGSGNTSSALFAYENILGDNGAREELTAEEREKRDLATLQN